MFQFVDTRDGLFQEHPEALRPRVFVTVMKRQGVEVASYCITHYEILQDGQAIQWPGLPKENCGFDFWYFIVSDIKDVNMIRNGRALPQKVKSIEPVSQADGTV